jgi:hypothetical protein
MHILERYALSGGLKIDKPYIYSKFFPVTLEKYIFFYPFTKNNSKNYDYWQEVVDAIFPHLEKLNIKLVQIGKKDDRPLNYCINLLGQATIPQMSFLMENSLFYLGSDAFTAHFASYFNKKIIALYNSNLNNSKPYWSNENDNFLIKYESDKKPYYSDGENPKLINSIKPETIIKAVFDLLQIKDAKIPKSIFFGNEYNSKTFEVVLDGEINPMAINISNPIIRMDYFFNEKVLESFLQTKKCIIFTNKNINIDLLRKYKENIGQVIYILEQENDSNFIKDLKLNVIPFVVISYLNEEEINKFKLQYMDLCLIVKKDYGIKLDLNLSKIDNLYYKSNKIIISTKGQFNSKYSWFNNLNDNKVSNDEEFYKEINNFYIYSID